MSESGEGPSGPAERKTLGPSGPAERKTPGPSGPAERKTPGPSGPAERKTPGPSDPAEREVDGHEGDDLALLVDAAGGDADAWLALWPKLRVAALGQAYVWLGSGPEAVDAVVDALAELLDQAEVGDLDPAVPLQAEVAAAVRDHAIDVLQGRLADGMGPPEDTEPLAVALPAAEQDALLDGLAGLARLERESLWLVAALGLHPDDAAAVMGEAADGTAVADAADRAAAALRGHWADAVADAPSAELDPTHLLSALVPEGPPADGLWHRIDRRRSGLDLAGDGDDRLTLALVGGAGIGVGVKVLDESPDHLWPDDHDLPGESTEGDEPAEPAAEVPPVAAAALASEPAAWDAQREDEFADLFDDPATAAGTAFAATAGDLPRRPEPSAFSDTPPPPPPPRSRARLGLAAAAAVVILVLGLLAAYMIVRDGDATVATRSPVSTTSEPVRSTSSSSTSTTTPRPTTTFFIPPPTTAPAASVPPVTTPKTTTTKPKPKPTTTTTTKPAPPPPTYFFDDLDAAGVPMGQDEPTAQRLFTEKFGNPKTVDTVAGGTAENCDAVPEHREARFGNGLRVAYIDSLQYWQLEPGAGTENLQIKDTHIHLGSSQSEVRSAGYTIEADGTFRSDHSPNDPQMIYGRIDAGGIVNLLSNYSHCGSNIFP